MALTLADLLDTFEDRLHLQTPVDDSRLETPIEWVAPTELLDPTPFLSGSELILTTGNALMDATKATYELYVERLASIGSVALGFATGLNHPTVPPGLIEAARVHDLPLFEVPYQTFFVEISKVVAESVTAEKYKLLNDSLTIHERLASVLLSGGDLKAMVKRLKQATGGAAAVIDIYGRLLASSPPSAQWPSNLHEHDEHDSDLTRTGYHTAPIRFESQLVAHLYLRITDDSFSPHAIPYATTLISLEMSRRHAELNGRRELVGQVVEDFLAQRVSDQDASQKLTAFGIDLNQPISILIASTTITISPSRILAGEKEFDANLSGTISAYVGGDLIYLANKNVDLDELSTALHRRLRSVDSTAKIGIGRPHHGVPGLRLSYFEAKEAISKSEPGVYYSEPINLSTLLLTSRELPIYDLACELLEPLKKHDEERDSQLLHTLRVFLGASGSIAKASRILNLHRNSMRYRLNLIHELTGHDMTVFTEQVKMWIAVQALEMNGQASKDELASPE